MNAMTWKTTAIAASIAMLLAVPAAHAQTAAADDNPWRVDVGIGFDNGISGKINASGIGQINNQVVVIKSNTFDDVYGTGLHLRFGVGYALSEVTEVTGMFTFQSLDADEVVAMGDIGVSNLYGQYSDYQTFAFDVGLRRYMPASERFLPYGEGTIGFGFVDKPDIELVAPGANNFRDATDFYDQSTAFSLGINGGLVFKSSGNVDYYGQLGLRWLSGMSEVDDLQGTGLDDINNKSARITLPFVVGVRFRF